MHAADDAMLADPEMQRLAADQVSAHQDAAAKEAAYLRACLMRRNRILAYVSDLTERDTSIYSDPEAYRLRVQALTADFATFCVGFYADRDAWLKAQERFRQTSRTLDARMRVLKQIPEPLEP